MPVLIEDQPVKLLSSRRMPAMPWIRYKRGDKRGQVKLNTDKRWIVALMKSRCDRAFVNAVAAVNAAMVYATRHAATGVTGAVAGTKVTTLIFVRPTIVKSGGQEHLGQRVMFPGYVFVHGLADEIRYLCRSTSPNGGGGGGGGGGGAVNAPGKYCYDTIMLPDAGQVALHADLLKLYGRFRGASELSAEAGAETVTEGLQEIKPGTSVAILSPSNYAGLEGKIVGQATVTSENIGENVPRVKVQIHVGMLGAMEVIMPQDWVQVLL